MTIKITHNWLLEYLEIDATPYDIQKYLSLSGPSVEKVEKVQMDYVYDIEITSNRVDGASVFGIAQECQAILPQFGKKAKLKHNPLIAYKFDILPIGDGRTKYLNIKITKNNLCSRFTAIVLGDVKINQSPDFIKDRLTMCGIKSINNVVDISNYLMLALGQPVHIFDYDKIEKSTMIMRQSKKGEKIITLDEKEIKLPGGDIVIEDGNENLIDLCGIMGGLNSAVFKTTKTIILFVQTYNKQKIRQTSMLTGQRTVAAAYFEKGLDEERVEPTLVYGVELLQKYAQAKIASQLYDIYPKPYKKKILDIRCSILEKIIGVKIEKNKLISILENLGFVVKNKSNDTLSVVIPSYRKDDINIKEDIVEEVARVYGYHNLPNNLSPAVYVAQPKDLEKLFYFQQKIKYFLKHLGLNEVVNYSMISKNLIENVGLKLSNHLRLSNSISYEIEYMRTSLLPSLVKNIKDNTGKKDVLKFFEIAKVYYPKKNNLPEEVYKLGIAANTNFFDLKGIIVALLSELNIENYQINYVNNDTFFSTSIQAAIFIDKKLIGQLGQFKIELKIRNELKSDIFLAEIDLISLIEYNKITPFYKQINPFATIKRDLTIKISPKLSFEKIKKTVFEKSKLLNRIELLDLFEDKITIRLYFTSSKRNITEKEANKDLEKITKSFIKD